MEPLHKPGEIVAQRYRIIDTLGQGGSGTTYKAQDRRGKQVALKALSLRRMTDWKMMELFEWEARVLAQLNHPAIPRYLEYFHVDTPEDRLFYIAQQLAPGQSLALLVQKGWRTNEEKVRRIAIQILEVLVYLHELKPPVIHRDIEPQNIIRKEDGQVFLVDFGAIQNTDHNIFIRSSTAVGTYGYMAPEQFRGQAVPTTDLYGLGATLLFLLTHRSPADLPTDRLKINFRSRVQISEEFADWLQRMLEPDVEDRFLSAKEALAVLRDQQMITSKIRPSGTYTELLHQPGEIVAQRYRILDILGQGGIGTTYEAQDLQSSQQVALKALSLRRMSDWKMMELFEREARILSQLNHPVIPRYLDYFQVDTAQDRSFYIAQQLVPGKSLAVLVENGWHPDMSEVWHITIQILDILVYLHSLTPPVIHRDIKPQNIIRQKNGRVFLVDFGSVQDIYHNTVTGGSTVVGTYGYMAPEQFRGQAVLSTDLYGLGTTLLFLLTGQSPAKLPQRKLKIDFRSHVRVFQEFADWLEKMLEPAIEDRFSSAKEALTVLWGEQVHTTCLAQKPHSPKISPITSIGIAAGITAGIALCFFILLVQPNSFVFRWFNYYALVYTRQGILLSLAVAALLGIFLALVLAVQFNKAYVYYSQAVYRHRREDYHTAIENYNQAIRLNPKYAKAYINRGTARLALRDYQGAIEDYNQAIRLNPKYAQAYINRSAARLALRDYQGAIEDYNQVIRLSPCATYYYNRGVTHYQLGNNQEAIEDMTQVLRFNPVCSSAYYNRGNARHNLGDKLGAFEDYNQARLIEPRNAIAADDQHGYYGRGLARSRQGDNQGSLEDLHKAAALCSEHRNTALYQRVQEAIRNLQI